MKITDYVFNDSSEVINLLYSLNDYLYVRKEVFASELHTEFLWRD